MSKATVTLSFNQNVLIVTTHLIRDHPARLAVQTSDPNVNIAVVEEYPYFAVFRISDHPQPAGTAFGTRANVGWTNGNRRLDRGNCSASATDRRHILNLSGVAETPAFSSPALRAVGSNWRFSAILKVLSGESLSVTTSQDRALNGMGGQRVDQLLPNVYGDKSVSNYLNPAAFALPALGTFANLGVGNIAGPGTWQFDVALSKTYQLGETQKLEFRAETFNVTNSFRMENPTTNLNSNIFGQVTSARDPRIMQFALKYVF